MTINAIRAQLKTVILTVSGIGVVYDYKRFCNDWATYRDLFVKDSKVNEWEIQRNGFSVIGHGGNGIVKDNNHDLILRGFYAFTDTPSSEKVFDTLIDAITDKLILQPNLSGTAKIVHIPYVGTIDMKFLGQVLCHVVEIQLQVEERTILQ